jgi:adenylosuccinate synthase
VEHLRGFGVQAFPLVSRAVHVVLPLHRMVDGRLEELRGGAAIGTTLRGIGPAYADKMLRLGVRAGDLAEPAHTAAKASLLQKIHGMGFEVDLEGLRKVVEPFLGDVSGYLNEVLDSGLRVVLEGAQGTLLDIDHGTYPYVTSSNTVAAAGFVSTGIPVQRHGRIVGVMKAYTTRVGEGPFPTEITGPLAEALRERGGEYGTTTGRPRRVGWLDIPALKHACRINGATEIAVTKLDILSGLDEIRVCVRYLLDGSEVDVFAEALPWLGRVEPVYEVFRGWKTSAGGVGAEPSDMAGMRCHRRCANTSDGLRKPLNTPITIASVGEEAGMIVLRESIR